MHIIYGFQCLCALHWRKRERERERAACAAGVKRPKCFRKAPPITFGALLSDNPTSRVLVASNKLNEAGWWTRKLVEQLYRGRSKCSINRWILGHASIRSTSLETRSIGILCNLKSNKKFMNTERRSVNGLQSLTYWWAKLWDKLKASSVFSLIKNFYAMAFSMVPSPLVQTTGF